MPVKRKVSKRRNAGLSEEVEGHFLGDPEHRHLYFHDDDEVHQMWREWSDVLLADWIAVNPCTRPRGWWMFDSPEPRRRIGGKGTAMHDALAGVGEHFDMGLPATGYVDQFLHDYYNGVAHDIHGKPIANGRKPGDFAAEIFDPDDPPRFETEAAYLARLGLLFDGEAARCQ